MIVNEWPSFLLGHQAQPQACERTFSVHQAELCTEVCKRAQRAPLTRAERLSYLNTGDMASRLPPLPCAEHSHLTLSSTHTALLWAIPRTRLPRVFDSLAFSHYSGFVFVFFSRLFFPSCICYSFSTTTPCQVHTAFSQGAATKCTLVPLCLRILTPIK